MMVGWLKFRNEWKAIICCFMLFPDWKEIVGWMSVVICCHGHQGCQKQWELSLTFKKQKCFPNLQLWESTKKSEVHGNIKEILFKFPKFRSKIQKSWSSLNELTGFMGQPFPWVGLSHSGPMQSALEVYFSHVLIALGEKFRTEFRTTPKIPK